jgi:nicastrin
VVSVLGALTVDEQTLYVGQEPCVRLFNAKGTVGCGTQRDGTTQPLFNIKDEATMDEFVSKAKGSSAVLLLASLFTKDNVEKISGTGRVGGIMVYDPSDNYKPEAGFSAAPLGNPYNPKATGFSSSDFKYVPIVKVEQEDVNKLLDMAQRNKNQRDSSMLLPKFMAKLKFYMGGNGKEKLDAITSTSCLEWTNFKGQRSPQCQPLGGISTWATTEPLSLPKAAAKKVIMATANIDGSSLFHDLVPAANAAASGVIAILAAAEALSGVNIKANGLTKTVPELKNTIAYSLLQGETWDQIGSRNFVNDINRFQTSSTCQVPVPATASPTGEEMCLNPLRRSLAFKKLTGDKIAHLIAVEQVGIGEKISLHPHDTSAVATAATIANSACASGTCTKLAFNPGLQPPTPVDSFAKLFKKQGTSTTKSMVFSRYADKYAEPNYFQSQYDNITTAPELESYAAKVADAATQLARTLYYLADDSSTSSTELDKIKVNSTLVTELTQCIIGNWECDLFKKYVASTYRNLWSGAGAFPQFDITPSIRPTIPSLYTSVASISNIPFNIPYVRLAVGDNQNWLTKLPKCEKDPETGIDPCAADGNGAGKNNPKYAKDTCSCGGYELQNNTKPAETDADYGLLMNANKEPVSIEEWPKSTYEAFLRAFLVEQTTANRTSYPCDNTIDCLKVSTVHA